MEPTTLDEFIRDFIVYGGAFSCGLASYLAVVNFYAFFRHEDLFSFFYALARLGWLMAIGTATWSVAHQPTEVMKDNPHAWSFLVGLFLGFVGFIGIVYSHHTRTTRGRF